MSRRIYTTAFTVPALTAIATPFNQAVPLDDVNLDSVRIIIAPGHQALTGLAIFWSTAQIAPYGLGTWITGDNEIIDYPFDGEITAGGIFLNGYNLDIFPHTFRLRWLVSDRYTGGPVATSSVQLGTAPVPTDLASIASMASSPADAGQAADSGQAATPVPDLSGAGV